MIIYLDMDGVLADYFTFVFDVFHEDFEQLTMPKPWPYAIHAWIGIPAKELYKELYKRSPNFWMRISPYSWCDTLVRELQQRVGVENLYIVTHPQPDQRCFAHKLAWVQDNLPTVPIRNLIYCVDKHLFSRPGTILIDDCERNVNLFTGMGEGYSVLFPQPWNSNYKIEDFKDSWVLQQVDRIITTYESR